jgi:hypothetical protein
MITRQKFIMLQGRCPSLLPVSIHALQLCHGILLNCRFYYAHYRFVGREIRADWLQSQHSQRGRGFQGSMDVIVLVRLLCLV